MHKGCFVNWFLSLPMYIVEEIKIMTFSNLLLVKIVLVLN
jgi:hypothetical protein